MESIYYVVSWACHRKCKHCYETKFRPYVRDELEAVISEAEAAFPQIIENLPERHTFLDLEVPDPTAPGGFVERPGRFILSGGEVLVEPARERIFYPVLEQLQERYRGQGNPVVIQTTGDLVTEQIIDDLLERGVTMISVAGMDDFHVGMEGDKRIPVKEKLTRMFEAAGMQKEGRQTPVRGDDTGTATFGFFGATEEAWIGKIWPRGRAWENDLSRATITDNFCNAWSGGLNFLNHRYAGSEVSIEPNGDVYPCCLKTRCPVGNLKEEPLLEILESLEGHPAFEAISMGHPERMGLSFGWDVSKFYDQSSTKTPGGRDYQNLCIGCDRFHEQVLGPVIQDLREKRRAARAPKVRIA